MLFNLQFFPDDGIHVFGNLLHTHEVGKCYYCFKCISNIIFSTGHGLTVQHIRYNSECDVYEELEPIDRNLKYDFNFQQINHLQREVIIKPVDCCNLKCIFM